jgi:hypothetical protein
MPRVLDSSMFTNRAVAGSSPASRLVDEKDAQFAVDAAAKAFSAWEETTPAERARLFFKAAEIVKRRRTEIADVLARETGSTISFATFQQDLVAATLEQVAGWVYLPKGEVLQTNAPATHSIGVRRPLGVVASFTPWNGGEHPVMACCPLAACCRQYLCCEALRVCAGLGRLDACGDRGRGWFSGRCDQCGHTCPWSCRGDRGRVLRPTRSARDQPHWRRQNGAGTGRASWAHAKENGHGTGWLQLSFSETPLEQIRAIADGCHEQKVWM